MTALASGKTAPDFTLPAMDGSPFSLRDALTRGPVVLAFFKISCPVCQFAFPFLERIHRARGVTSVSIIGISQNERKDTAAFLQKFDITFPILLDDTKKYPVSNAYGLTNVPTVFWISPEGTIEISSVGWSRRDTEAIHRRAAELTGDAPLPLFLPTENIPETRPG